MKNKTWKKLLVSVLILIMCLGSLTVESQAARRDMTKGSWRKSGHSIHVLTPEGVRTYHIYNQLKPKGKNKLYFFQYGCVVTGLGIAASGFGSHVTPWMIHDSSASNPISERYALNQLQLKYEDAAISLRLSSQILTNLGITNKLVTSFSNEGAVEEIRNHLQAGKPVIVKVKNNTYRGVHFTNNHHTLVLLGMAGDYVFFLNPVTGKMNSSRTGRIKNKINLDLNTLVTQFMKCSEAEGTLGFIKRAKQSGGYILVG